MRLDADAYMVDMTIDIRGLPGTWSCNIIALIIFTFILLKVLFLTDSLSRLSIDIYLGCILEYFLNVFIYSENTFKTASYLFLI